MQVSLPAASSRTRFGRGFRLETLLENDAARIGTRAQYPGDALGTGVTAAAARELGLAPGTAVRRCSTQTPGGSAVSSATRATRRRDRRRTECLHGVQWVRARRSYAAPASARCGRRPGAASCWECGARYPRRSSFTCMQCMYMFITACWI